MKSMREWFSKQPEHIRSSLVLLLLSGLVLAGFWEVIRCDFVNFDDTEYVTENFGIQNGVSLNSLAWAFQTHHAGNWHPLTWVSHMMDYSLFGAKPAGHHLINLLLHLGNTLLLFLALKEMTGSLGRSAFVAALFGVHPMHVESVAWISERKDLLSGFFAMLTLWFYARYAGNLGTANADEHDSNQRRGRGSYWIALLTFALGLLSKPMLVTLPFVLLLLDFWPLGRIGTDRPENAFLPKFGGLIRLALEKVPFFVLSVASSIITYLVQKHAGAMTADPFSYRFLNAFGSYVDYVYKLVWPTNLCVFYPLPEQTHLTRGIISLLLVLAVSGLIVWRSGQRRYLFTGWCWFLGMLVPVIGFVQVGSQAMADRYSYLPSIGFFLVITWSAWEIVGARKVLSWIAVVVIAACTVLTHRQVSYWQNSVALFSRVFAVVPETDKIDVQLGAALTFVGQREKGIQQFRRALELNPKNDEAHLDWGMTLIALGRDGEAVEHLKKSAELNPASPQVHDNLGIALAHLKRNDEAEAEFKKSLERLSENPAVLSRLGFAQMEQKKFREAEAAFSNALRLNPSLQEAHVYLGFICVTENRLDEAIEHCRAAVRLNPGDKQAQNNLNIVLARKRAQQQTPKP